MIDWARRRMPVMNGIAADIKESDTFHGHTVAVCSHLEAKTGVLIQVLAEAGARVVFTGSDPQSTQDDVVAALADLPNTHGAAAHGAGVEETRAMRLDVLEHHPTILLDDGAELLSVMVSARQDVLPGVIGSCEQTATGVSRIRRLAAPLPFPILRVNDTPMKRLFDNTLGTGESAVTSLAATLNLQLAGRTVIVVGYGHCGRGVAHRLRAWGSKVIVTEIDPRKALEAQVAGLDVMPLASAAPLGSLFITATGEREVIGLDDMRRMRDGAILANVGHAADEIAVHALQVAAESARAVRGGVVSYRLEPDREISLLGGGHPVNLTVPAAMGHPVEVIDLTLSLQLLGARHLVEHGAELGAGLQAFPDALDREAAERRLRALGISIDKESSRPDRPGQAQGNTS